MNKAYRLIWSKAGKRWEVVAEIITGNGGPAGVTVAATSSSRNQGQSQRFQLCRQQSLFQ